MWPNPQASATVQNTNAKRHRLGLHMRPLSFNTRACRKTPPGGSASPRPGGALYDPVVAARVLLVEPNRIVRAGMRAEVSRDGADVVAEAATGPGATAGPTGHRHEVVLLELRLPYQPGLEVCEALCALLPDSPIVVLAD